LVVAIRERLERLGQGRFAKFEIGQDAGPFSVFRRARHGFRVSVAAEDLAMEVWECAFVRASLRVVEEVFIVQRELFDRKPPVSAWCELACHPRGFDQDRARSHHRIDERSPTVPTRHPHQRVGEVLPEWRLAGVQPPSASVKWFPRAVE